MSLMPNSLGAAPYSQDAEEAVIGSVLINPDAYFNIASFLRADDFYILRHAYIWEAMTRIAERNEIVDILTVREELRAMNRLNDVGGAGYLTQLSINVPTSVHAEIYGRLVERAAVRRRLLQASDEIRMLAMDETLTLDNVTSQAESKLFSVTERSMRRDMMPMREAVSNYFDRMEHLMQHPDEPLGLPSGFRDLDAMLGGLQRSDLLIFAGRPGMGKTSFLLTVALNAAKLGARILIFTMEMGSDQLVQRFLSMETGINTQKLRLGQLDQREWSRFVQATGRLGNLRIVIDDTPAQSPIQIRTKSRRMAHEMGLDLIIVDYLQLMSAGQGYENNRVQEISHISRNLKEIAREINVPMFAAAQLSRAVESRQDKHPQLSDLRESGCLTGETRIYLPDVGRFASMRDLIGKRDFIVLSLNLETQQIEAHAVSNAFSTGIKPVYKLITRDGRAIRATANHPFLTPQGWTRLDALAVGDLLCVPSQALETILPVEQFAYVGGDSVPTEPRPQPHTAWDSIASIEADGIEEVFDLTVPAHSNFIANGLIVHNSIEQDADVVLFLYRESMYNEASEHPNLAEVMISKHRNGPTGSVNLHFEKGLTKFSDVRTQSIDLSTL